MISSQQAPATLVKTTKADQKRTSKRMWKVCLWVPSSFVLFDRRDAKPRKCLGVSHYFLIWVQIGRPRIWAQDTVGLIEKGCFKYITHKSCSASGGPCLLSWRDTYMHTLWRPRISTPCLGRTLVEGATWRRCFTGSKTDRPTWREWSDHKLFDKRTSIWRSLRGGRVCILFSSENKNSDI